MNSEVVSFTITDDDDEVVEGDDDDGLGTFRVSISCPPIGTSRDLTRYTNILTFERSLAQTFCGIYIQRENLDGDISLIPYARSYSYPWESAPGPYASPSQNIECSSNEVGCEIELAPLSADGDRYVILAKDGKVDYRKQIARFLEMTTFGPTKAEIEALAADGDWDLESRAQYVRRQMDTHKNDAPRLVENFSTMNAALEAFVEELKTLSSGNLLSYCSFLNSAGRFLQTLVMVLTTVGEGIISC
jgi:hypothetical protein